MQRPKFLESVSASLDPGVRQAQKYFRLNPVQTWRLVDKIHCVHNHPKSVLFIGGAGFPQCGNIDSSSVLHPENSSFLPVSKNVCVLCVAPLFFVFFLVVRHPPPQQRVRKTYLVF